MKEIAHYHDEVWDRFFDLLYPCEEKLTRSEIQDGLKRMDIEVSKAVNRVQQALATAQAREQLAAASQARPAFLAKLGDISFPVVDNLREKLHQLIEGKFKGTLQAAYFRKLESAATDADLESLFDDIQRLDAMP